MVRRLTGRLMFQSMLAALAIVMLALPLAAQSGGTVRGVVRDDKGQPVNGATVTIVSDDTSRKFETRTNRRGEFLQIGLGSGSYTLTARKDKLASAPTKVQVRVGQAQQIDFVLGVAGAATTEEAMKRAAELKQYFDAGVAAGNAGKHEEAIAQFRQAAEVSPNCHECYNNIGFAYSQMKNWEQAEAAYKKATEIKPDDAAAYNGLASVYNAQRKFDLAAEASAKAAQLGGGAAGGGSADALFNQGVILWNGGNVAEAKKQFEAAIAADPNHAEAHYQLGMALVNEGNLAGAATEFETYLKLSPSGPNAAQAKALVDQLKKQ